jgi:hypothetical protein
MKENSIGHHIRYFREDHKPDIHVTTRKVAEGVHYLEIELGERLSVDAYSSEDEWESVLFGDEKDILLEVIFESDSSAFIFGEASKTTYYGTLYEHSTYEKLMED